MFVEFVFDPNVAVLPIAADGLGIEFLDERSGWTLTMEVDPDAGPDIDRLIEQLQALKDRLAALRKKPSPESPGRKKGRSRRASGPHPNRQ
jgi:hypothetical protein